MTRNSKGQFVKKSTAQKVRELNAKGLSNTAIAKQLNIRPQNVFRALNRSKFNAKRIRVTDAVRALATEENECTNELCREGQSATCECPCQGTWHGVSLLTVALA